MKKKGISLNIDNNEDNSGIINNNNDAVVKQENISPFQNKRNKKPQLLISNEEETEIQEKTKSEYNSCDKYHEKFQEPERLFIQNHTDPLIQNLVNYMEGANNGLDLSYFWYNLK
jgi:hypothetical protein